MFGGSVVVVVGGSKNATGGKKDGLGDDELAPKVECVSADVFSADFFK